MKNKPIQIFFPNPNSANDQFFLDLVNLVNSVYAKAEAGMWQESGLRTNVIEIKRLVNEKRLILARLDDQIVGLVAVRLMEDSETSEFGMLVVDPEYRKLKVGSLLVASAEKWAQQNSCTHMRLELLTPRNWKHPSKEFLKKWYRKIGYKPTKTEPFELLHPDKIDALATDCDFTVWLKKLS
jgi:GNAT superfamily N-acetyltransferase